MQSPTLKKLNPSFQSTLLKPAGDSWVLIWKGCKKTALPIYLGLEWPGRWTGEGVTFFFSHSDDDASLSAHRKHAPVSSSALMTGLPSEDGSYAHAVVYMRLARMRASVCLISCVHN